MMVSHMKRRPLRIVWRARIGKWDAYIGRYHSYGPTREDAVLNLITFLEAECEFYYQRSRTGRRK